MSKQSKNPKGIHDGHRRRIIKKYRALGITGLKESERMEILLFPMIPRGDTALISQRCIERFGSVIGVVDADYQDIVEAVDIGEGLAAELCLLGEIHKMVREGEWIRRLGEPVVLKNNPLFCKEWVFK
ncbi:MAG: hypothetical protein K2N06_00335 [Oscillospiraceae bacterium]|nr:hypothetical protein [Oscillospiraceae bacterium]